LYHHRICPFFLRQKDGISIVVNVRFTPANHTKTAHTKFSVFIIPVAFQVETCLKPNKGCEGNPVLLREQQLNQIQFMEPIPSQVNGYSTSFFSWPLRKPVPVNL